MGILQQNALPNFSGWLTGLTPEIQADKPVIFSWIPIDLAPPDPSLGVEDSGFFSELPEKTSEYFNDFNMRLDDLVGEYDVPFQDPDIGLMYPGGRPLDMNIQNAITRYYMRNSTSFSEELLHTRLVNHTFNSIFTENQKKSAWYYTHRGEFGGRGGSVNRVSIFGDNWPIDTTLDDDSDPHVLHPNADSLLPFVFGVNNYPSLLASVANNIDIDSYSPITVPSKIYFSLEGTKNDTETEVDVVLPPQINSTSSLYKRVIPSELEKKAFAPVNIIYIKYDDPILKFLLHPTASVRWTKLQYNVEALGGTYMVNNIPRILVFMPTDNVAYYILNGAGSKMATLTTRTMNFCRELNPRGWYTHSFDHPDIVVS